MLNSNIETTIINSQGSSYYLDKDITLKGNPLLKRYHGNEQKINTRIINNAIGMIWAGIIIIAFGIGMAFMKEGISTGIISLVSGAVIELISGTILVLAKYEMNSKDKYFETLSKTEDHRQLIDFINSIQNDEIRAKCQEQYVNQYTSLFMK